MYHDFYILICLTKVWSKVPKATLSRFPDSQWVWSSSFKWVYFFFLSKFVSHSGESSFGSLFPNMTNFIDFPDMNHTCLLPFKTVSPSLCNIAKLNRSLEGMLLPSSLQTIWLQIWGISIEWEGPTELRTSSGAGVQRALNTELPVFISLWGLRQHYLLLAMLRDSMLRKLPWSFGSQRLYGAQHHTALKSHL